ncbi:MAG: PfaD family polyunsaturated fatty acid/polyketide biosynthesis protein [Desulfobacterales bacterium]|nr:MAG: PfaD family polyunsaturated fatty acid/polyketide biosynthesis protein [Desulfobacterales bacterium]
MQSFNHAKKILGWWTPADAPPETGTRALKAAIFQVDRTVICLNINDQLAVGAAGAITLGDLRPSSQAGAIPVVGYVPALPPENLGDSCFKQAHNLRYAYIAGAMANGITSVEMVAEMGRAGMIGFFGAAGLPLHEVEKAIHHLQSHLHQLPFGFNLIHSPGDLELETAVVDLYLRRGIRRISASAYLDLTLPLVYYRVKGIQRDPRGRVVCPNKIIAKVSRIEVARKFFSPPPLKFLSQLVDRKMITEEDAALAASIPMAEDLTAEADSGGHTDNRPAITLLPTMLALRDELAARYNYEMPLHVGLAGGIATPNSAAAAFAMGAAYVLTGSINQACVESGTSATVCQMLAEASQADVTMAPAADMFEMGVKVQVLKRGTMFPLRAAKLYELYSQYDCYADIPAKQREILERDYFRSSFEEEWQQTRQFFSRRDPRQIILAEENPKHKMALVFRSYLGRSSNWAKSGDPSRKIDYQIWCGPAIGAFNQWVKGSFLEKPENRKIVTVAMNLMLGAAVITRVNWLRHQGLVLPAEVGNFTPMTLAEIDGCLNPKAEMLPASKAV